MPDFYEQHGFTKDAKVKRSRRREAFKPGDQLRFVDAQADLGSPLVDIIERRPNDRYLVRFPAGGTMIVPADRLERLASRP